MEIKQLQPYPLGIKGLKLIEEGLKGQNVITCWGVNIKYQYVHVDPNESIGAYRQLYVQGITPILYPLSSLTQEIEVYGERFIPKNIISGLDNRFPFHDGHFLEMESHDLSNGKIRHTHLDYKTLPYWIIQLLQSWFINYQNIEAVSPFDLETNPYK